MSQLTDETDETDDFGFATDVLIIGAGPAGLYGAYYAGFRGLSVTVMDVLPQLGGQISAMYPEKPIFDIAGFLSVRGRDLVDGLVAQAEPYAPRYLLGHRAVELTHGVDGRPVVRSDQGATVRAGAVVITGGVGTFTPRALKPVRSSSGGAWSTSCRTRPCTRTRTWWSSAAATAPSTGQRCSPRSPAP